MIDLFIRYRDGTEKTLCVDDCCVRDGCFVYYIRFGQNSGEHHIPLDLIAEWKTQR